MAATAGLSSSSRSYLPQWLGEFYSKFPLVQLEPEDSTRSIYASGDIRKDNCLWIHETRGEGSSSSFAQYRWASTDPNSLRYQLLFLLNPRTPPLEFRRYGREDNAPEGTLPCLEIKSERRLISTSNLRAWYDEQYPPSVGRKGLKGMPDQATYDRAMAVARLVLDRLYPAFLASTPQPPLSSLHLHLPFAPPLASGLVTPLPASLTGDMRHIDTDRVIAEGDDALTALEEILDPNDWALGVSQPTPLDSLVTSHLYCLYGLPAGSRLRDHLEQSSSLGGYVGGVMSHAGERG